MGLPFSESPKDCSEILRSKEPGRGNNNQPPGWLSTTQVDPWAKTSSSTASISPLKVRPVKLHGLLKGSSRMGVFAYTSKIVSTERLSIGTRNLSDPGTTGSCVSSAVALKPSLSPSDAAARSSHCRSSHSSRRLSSSTSERTPSKSLLILPSKSTYVSLSFLRWLTEI